MRWLNSFCLTSMAFGAVVSGAAMAADNTVERPAAPLAPLMLSCPAGTTQTGGATSPYEATFCVKTGTRTFHGPYVVQWANGRKRAEGQYENGMREGRWRFYSEDGSLIGETDFHAGNYHGTRVEYHANGRKKLEETWVNGKREGEVREFDPQGNVVKVQIFKADRVVSTR